MLVQFVKSYTRSGEARARRPGELLEVPDREADALIAEGIAKAHQIGPPIETKGDPC